MKKYLAVLGAALAVVMIATMASCSSGSGDITLEQKTAVISPSAEPSPSTGLESDRVVPAIGYQCADGTMVYSTDTSHERDGEKWKVVYEATSQLEAQC